MKHLFCHSVYHQEEGLEGSAEEVIASLRGIGADGLELLVGYSPADPVYGGAVTGVHLPYATDWFSAWNGTAEFEGLSDRDVRYTFFGRDREGMVASIRSAVEHASALSPEYGVMHAGSVRLDSIFTDDRGQDEAVLAAFCEMMNSVASGLPGNDFPFRILFENLWWPGLRLTDPKEMSVLQDNLEFGNWGLCLDTGHMMAAAGGYTDEREAGEGLLEIFSEYPEEMKERISAVHLHSAVSTERPEAPAVDGGIGHDRLMSLAYDYVSRLDPHRPFRTDICRRIVDELDPAYVTHELPSAGLRERKELFVLQRSFFPAPESYK